MKVKLCDYSKCLEYVCQFNEKITHRDFKVLAMFLSQGDGFNVKPSLLSLKLNTDRSAIYTSLKRLVKSNILSIENESNIVGLKTEKSYIISKSFVKKAQDFHNYRYSKTDEIPGYYFDSVEDDNDISKEH